MLPLLATPVLALGVGKDAENAGSDPLVLVVDDDEDVLRYLVELLRLAPTRMKVVTATSGEAALEILANAPVELVLSDYRMKRMNGVELLKRAHAEHPDTLRVLVTGYADWDIAMHALNEGHIHAFYEKPIDSSALLEKIARLLSDKKAGTLRERAFDRATHANGA